MTAASIPFTVTFAKPSLTVPETVTCGRRVRSPAAGAATVTAGAAVSRVTETATVALLPARSTAVMKKLLPPSARVQGRLQPSPTTEAALPFTVTELTCSFTEPANVIGASFKKESAIGAATATTGAVVSRVMPVLNAADQLPATSWYCTWTGFGPSPGERVQDAPAENGVGAVQVIPFPLKRMFATPFWSEALSCSETSAEPVTAAPELTTMLPVGAASS